MFQSPRVPIYLTTARRQIKTRLWQKGCDAGLTENYLPRLSSRFIILPKFAYVFSIV